MLEKIFNPYLLTSALIYLWAWLLLSMLNVYGELYLNKKLYFGEAFIRFRNPINLKLLNNQVYKGCC